ncbi:MAG: HAD family hydrolase [Clostridia bacterium]|nr:HAD family hydrolase [Clostridia bacterium]
MKYKHIIWDWNGTLLDDVKASLFAVNDILDIYGKPRLDLKTYYSYVDTPIYKFYERIFDLSVVTMDTIKPLYGKFYDGYEKGVKLSLGARELILENKKKGIKQYILSAAHIDDLTRHAKRLGVYDMFDRIDASPDFEAGSKIDRAKTLMREEGIAPDECVLIGDTLHDLETANELGVKCILYSKGHTDYGKLEKTGEKVCQSFEEIRNEILNI